MRMILLAGCAGVALAPPAAAQTAPVTPPHADQVFETAVPPSGPQQGVLVYPPSFFASSSPNTAFDMIQRLPGFALEFGNTEARGLAGSAGNVLIDGDRPASKTDTLDQVLRRIAVASVERIELIRGGAPGIDMQGRAVIANVVLRKVATTELAVEGNTYIYTDGYFGPSGKVSYSRREGDSSTEGSIFATTDRTGGTADGSRTRFNAAGAVTQQADLDLWDRLRNVSARGAVQRWFGGGKVRINGLADFNSSENSQDVDVISGAGADEHNESIARNWTGELGATWNRQLGSKSELELIAIQKLRKNDFESASLNGGGASTFESDSTSGESVARAVWKYRPSDRWSFESGGEVAYNYLDSTTAFSSRGVAVPLPNASVLVSELRGEGFGQGTWRASPKLTLEAGIRFELSRISQSGDTDKAKSFTYPKPRAQLTWLPATGHQVRLRAEKSVSQLNFGQFVASTEINLGTVVGGNADLVPQKELLLEAVYEHRFWDKGSIELLAQHREIDDVIDIIPLVGGFEAIGNVGKGTRDFYQIRFTLPLDRLGLANARLVGRTNWSESSLTDPLTGQTRRFSGEVPWGCGFSFNHDLKGGRFSYGLDHGCNIDESTSFRVREVRYNEFQPYVGVYGQWKPASDLTVRLDLGNATNSRGVSLRDLYSGPRTTSPLATRELRSTRQGEWLFVQIRKVV